MVSYTAVDDTPASRLLHVRFSTLLKLTCNRVSSFPSIWSSSRPVALARRFTLVICSSVLLARNTHVKLRKKQAPGSLSRKCELPVEGGRRVGRKNSTRGGTHLAFGQTVDSRSRWGTEEDTCIARVRLAFKVAASSLPETLGILSRV